ncbi:uncharacterized protein V1516DRAFT_672638 [Lipomyces oligophaga]|uniref:uncharacterized protein n=1 Tax=Lipomyces oligophaga TaxID=45792 RepID=UPI0034CDBF8F
MSFHLSWPFSTEQNVYPRAAALLTDALNKGTKPPIIVDDILVKELNFGKEPPQLEILEIGDLADDRFRGVFKVNYGGDAFMTLQTPVEANALNIYSHLTPSFTNPGFLAAHSSLNIPLTITLSEIKVSGIVILVFSKAKGATIVFRNDPLESIKISSTFDSVPAIARLIQTQIENQLRHLFREDLPTIIYKLSQRWTPNATPSVSTPATPVGEKVSANPKSSGPAGGTTVPPSSPRTKPVTLAEVNQDLPSLSPTNIVQLNLLGQAQQTLSLSTPSIPDALCRSMIARHGEREDEFKDDDDLSSIMLRSRRTAKSGKARRPHKVFNLRKNQEPIGQ